MNKKYLLASLILIFVATVVIWNSGRSQQTVVGADYIQLRDGSRIPIGSIATGIPGATGEKGAKGDKGEPGEKNLIYPESYGAKGDGVTDDGPAIRAMLADIPNQRPKRKVWLSPENYYCIKTSANATNVFEISTPSLVIEGPGMSIKTIAYEGTATVTNFISIMGGATADYLRISDMKIVGDKVKVQNLVMLNAAIGLTMERCWLWGASGKCVTGFNWMTNLNHCIFDNADVGVDQIATMAHVENCYANSCRVGFAIFSRYGTYISCAVDWADIAYKLEEPWSVALIGCGCEQSKQAIVGMACQITIQAFQVDQTGMTDLPQACFDLSNTSGQITAMFGKINNQYFLKARGCPNLVVGPEFPADRKLIL